jgi:molybdopterin converting factor small subunit
MAIIIKTLRPLSEWLGGSRIEMEWSGGTLEDLIRALIKRSGLELEKELKGEDGSLAYIVSVNGKIGRELTTPIPDGAEVFFFTPLGGG